MSECAPPLGDKAALMLALYRSQFGPFLRLAFRETARAPDLIDAWHVELMAHRLGRVWAKRTPRLVLNAPPRCAKSFCASIALPLFMLGTDPRATVIVIAGSQALANELRERARQVLRADRVRAVFPHLRPEVVDAVPTAYGGQLTFAVYGRSLVGRSADLIVLDDLQAPKHIEDARWRREMNAIFDAEVAPRVVEGQGRLVLVTQRLHPEDLTAHILEQDRTLRRARLTLPAIALANEYWRLGNGRTHLRRKGDMLQPAFENRAALEARCAEVDAVVFASQYLQRPFWAKWSGYQCLWRHDEDVAVNYTFGIPVDIGGFQWQPQGAHLFVDRVFNPPQFGPSGRRAMTMDEWEAVTIDQQRRLVAECEAFDAQIVGRRSEAVHPANDAPPAASPSDGATGAA